jgi:hypothetical protein
MDRFHGGPVGRRDPDGLRSITTAALNVLASQPAVSPRGADCIWLNEEEINVPDWLTIILVMAAYIVLMRWVLPRLGIGT